MRLYLLAPSLDSGRTNGLGCLEPEAVAAPIYSPPGSESFLYLLEGVARIELSGGRVLTLNAGDSASYRADEFEGMSNPHDDYRAALYAYNHAGWYVADVLAKAATYRGAARAGGELAIDPATVRELLGNPRIVLAPVQRADLQAGGIDPRLVTTLAAIGRRHTVLITTQRSDHYPGTNHEAGRAMDIGAVDGEICAGGRRGACAQLVRELAAVEGPLRSTELIYCWDPDGPADPRGFGRTDHCDHIHWGMDA